MKIEIDGLTFDSESEVLFFWWCEEALAAGFIDEFEQGGNTFVLSGSQKFDTVRLMKCTYTPDFTIKMTVHYPETKNILFLQEQIKPYKRHKVFRL